jgi:hypothetical protein
MVYQKRTHELQCRRCNHIWGARVEHPNICPKCKSQHWDGQKKEKEKHQKHHRHPDQLMICEKHGEVPFVYKVRAICFRQDGERKTAFESYWSCTMCAQERKAERHKKMLAVHENMKKMKLICAKCGNEYHQQHAGDLLGYCNLCQEKILAIQRDDARKQINKELLEKYKKERELCAHGEICDILKFHHDVLIEDPERMTTEFLLKMCGGDDAIGAYEVINAIKEGKI